MRFVAIAWLSALLTPAVAPPAAPADLFEQGAQAEERGDLTQAAGIYQRACDAGDGRACTNLGAFYVDGRGVAADPARAGQSFTRGCDADTGRGCQNWGILSEDGRGPPADLARAAQ